LTRNLSERDNATACGFCKLLGGASSWNVLSYRSSQQRARNTAHLHLSGTGWHSLDSRTLAMSVQHLHSESELSSALDKAGGSLVVIDYSGAR